MQRYWRTVTVTTRERHANFVRSTLSWVRLPTTFTQWVLHSDWWVSDSAIPHTKTQSKPVLPMPLLCHDFKNKYIFLCCNNPQLLLMMMINSGPVSVIKIKLNTALVTPVVLAVFHHNTPGVSLLSSLVTQSCHLDLHLDIEGWEDVL